MKNYIIAFIILIFFSTLSFAQRKVSTYFWGEYNKTLYDYTLGNNPWGIGLGLQSFLNNKTKFKPTIELTCDIYLMDDKVLRLNPDGSFPYEDNDLGTMVNLLAGTSFHPAQNIYVSLLGGPSFINGQTYFAIKPSFGFYLSKSRKWTGKISYINVFNRTKIVNEDFGTISFGLGVKCF